MKLLKSQASSRSSRTATFSFSNLLVCLLRACLLLGVLLSSGQSLEICNPRTTQELNPVKVIDELKVSDGESTTTFYSSHVEEMEKSEEQVEEEQRLNFIHLFFQCLIGYGMTFLMYFLFNPWLAFFMCVIGLLAWLLVHPSIFNTSPSVPPDRSRGTFREYKDYLATKYRCSLKKVKSHCTTEERRLLRKLWKLHLKILRFQLNVESPETSQYHTACTADFDKFDDRVQEEACHSSCAPESSTQEFSNQDALDQYNRVIESESTDASVQEDTSVMENDSSPLMRASYTPPILESWPTRCTE